MVVKIHGSREDKEYKYALQLKRMFEEDPQLKDETNIIDIFVCARCYCQNPEEIDIVLLGKLNNYSKEVMCEVLNLNDGEKLRLVKIYDFCTVIEVKEHDLEGVYFEGSELIVKYAGSMPHRAIHQNKKQVYSLRDYLGLKGRLFISSFVFLPNILINHLPEEIKGEKVTSYLLFSKPKLDDFWQSLMRQQGCKPTNKQGNVEYRASYSKNTSNNYVENSVIRLSEKIIPTRLDRIKMERICKQHLNNQQYEDKLGQQLLIFRGKGGTGKTYRLLNMAYELYEKYDSRIFILTYNNALVADIKRLFALMKISDGIGKSIQVESWLSFLWKMYHQMGVEVDEDENDPDKLEYKTQLNRNLSDKSAQQLLERVKAENPDLLYWDYIMVDEAQDWEPVEREILYNIFDFTKVIIADGVNQLIRNSTACSWRENPNIKNQVVPLKMSLRQKPNLNIFISRLLDEMNMSTWDLETDINSHGGKVLILVGEYNLDIHRELMEQNKQDKNKNIDMLFCVPPNYGGKKYPLIEKLEEGGYLVWDGTSKDTRKHTYPKNLDEFRVVQYESCRGLEGWICVNIGFDNLYKNKLNSYHEEKGQQDFTPIEDKRRLFAGNWLQIPLTRAMDTLVINIQDRRSPLYNILKKIYEDCPEFVEWREP